MPFVVFSLPRSRSAWLSAFMECGHDIGVQCATPEDFVAQIGAGTCETGAAFAYPLIRQLIPDCRFAVVRRPVAEVVGSFERLGITGLGPEMERRDRDLDAICAQRDVLTVDYADLKRQDTCAALYAHCRNAAMDLERWARLDGLNIQVDIVRQLTRLETNRSRIAGLKAEVFRRLAKPGLQVVLEPWSDAFWSDAEALATAHFEEVDGGVEPKRPFKLDTGFMQRLYDGGVLKLFTARIDGRLVGYYTWNVTSDVESQGLLIAQQGAWYVAPGHPRIAGKMFDTAVSELRAIGVQCIFPHHRAQGRGAAIGRFFQRRGAKKIQDTYSLWIGD